jgi:hypothetical protein
MAKAVDCQAGLFCGRLNEPWIVNSAQLPLPPVVVTSGMRELMRPPPIDPAAMADFITAHHAALRCHFQPACSLWFAERLPTA